MHPGKPRRGDSQDPIPVRRFTPRLPKQNRTLAPLALGLLLCVACNQPESAQTPGEDTSASQTTTAERPADLTIQEQLTNGRSGSGSKVQFVESQIDDDALQLLDASDDWLKTLTVDRGRITDEGMRAVARLPELIHLRLRESPITDAGLREIAQHPKLQILNLPQSMVTTEGVRELAQLPSLKNLRLGSERLGPEVADAISKLESLRTLHLIGVPINDDGLKQIATLPRLSSLYLDDAEVSGEGWDWFQENHPKIHVHVNQRHLDRSLPDHH
ncbi:hypothetical protein CGZ80_02930 [Rhodopirellula sp. MGV]|nr:hypothetical protein CGZ80_02930 [Rhodopirellula sp. MGV]